MEWVTIWLASTVSTNGSSIACFLMQLMSNPYTWFQTAQTRGGNEVWTKPQKNGTTWHDMHAHQEFSWAHYLKENTFNHKDRVDMETKGHTSLYYLLSPHWILDPIWMKKGLHKINNRENVVEGRAVLGGDNPKAWYQDQQGLAFLAIRGCTRFPIWTGKQIWEV